MSPIIKDVLIYYTARSGIVFDARQSGQIYICKLVSKLEIIVLDFLAYQVGWIF